MKKIFNAVLFTEHFELLHQAQTEEWKKNGVRPSLAELVRKAIEQVYGVPRA